ncbi:MAG: hypothetical protein KDA95_08585, partial [Acidimicrobiales bacterium]|nr:hypothetical protein [Acidimicrobiales bacterium]
MTARGQRARTAGELLDELEQKPEHQERQRQWKLQEDENRRRYGQAAAGLLADLEAAGFSVATLAELRQRGVGDRRAVPVLV